MNMIDSLAATEFTVEVYTNADVSGSGLKEFQSSGGRVLIRRFRPFVKRTSRFRILNDLGFYLFCLLRLLRFQPRTVLYYETISALPALLYKKMAGRRLNVMAHYHEYVTPAEYRNGMASVKLIHHLEERMYGQYTWISQTNEVRLQKFLDDNHLTANTTRHFSLANHPPRSWNTHPEMKTITGVKKLVYVGALGGGSMFFKELLEWIADKQASFSLDIYAYNIDTAAAALINANKLGHVRYHGGCSYHEIPGVLVQFDIGLVLYKPVSENAINAVPNKVFEYLSCGLDVWYPTEITYIRTLERKGLRPKVVPVDFRNLQGFDWRSAVDDSGTKYSDYNFSSEETNQLILSHIREHA